jgi:hypothetical protein
LRALLLFCNEYNEIKIKNRYKVRQNFTGNFI